MTKLTMGAIAVLVILLGIAGYTLKNLYEEVGQLEQANTELKQSLKEQAAENAELTAEMARRDSVVASTIRTRQMADKALASAQRKLREALADNECAATPHPDSVADSLRGLGAGDRDKDGVPVSTDSADGADPGA